MTLDPNAFVGCIIRIKVKNRWRIMLAVRLHDQKVAGRNWTNFTAITDTEKIYADLAIDALAVVAVSSKNKAFIVKQLYTLSLTKDGDTTTVLNAIKDGYLPGILDTSLVNEGLLSNKKT